MKPPGPSDRSGEINYRRARQAFTLIEIMVVVAIIGILAAVIIPQFGTTTYDAKVNAAKAHIQEYANAVERFNVNMDRYPTSEEGLAVLVDAPSGDDAKKWRGPYIDKVRPDPWGFPYKYLFPGTRHTSSYDLWSTGADGADGGEGQNADIGNWQ
ncbi:MAG: type II secretion system protein GspG [Verrucomicrobia bacterium]|nr:MAG: type II secretion system protein GspG [Verrucomicrobiota bacterium]